MPPAEPKTEETPMPPTGGAPAAPPANGAAAKTFTQEDVDRIVADRAKRAEESTRKSLLGKFKDDGIEDEAQLEALVKSAKAAEAAKLSETEKATKRIAKLEADLAAATTSAASAKEDARRVRLFAGAGVTEVVAVDALLTLARAEDDKLDEKKWLETLKKDKPFYFGQAQGAPAAPANTGAKPPPAGSPPAGGEKFDARTSEGKDLRAKATAAGLDPRLFRS